MAWFSFRLWRSLQRSPHARSTGAGGVETMAGAGAFNVQGFKGLRPVLSPEGQLDK